ncbi:MAG: hypothetical protein E6J20_04545 [Chloroflexi bacterium]|nr:MAG: hypothetical protein E6J20_04545 [Chloroflexota bacterium]
MAQLAARLAVDLSGTSIRVVEGTMGGQMRCGSASVPDGASAGGKVADPGAVARALKPLLARIEITQTRAFVAASDSLATFRILRLAATSTARDVDAAIARELSFDPQRMATRWMDVIDAEGQRVVYAAAWDQALIKNLTEAVKLADLEPVVVELKSASVARAVPAPACIVLDLSSDPAEIILLDGHLPRLWHSFKVKEPIGDDAVSTLASPLRTALRFYRRQSNGDFESSAPVFVSSEQALPSQLLTELSALIGQPVALLPIPARVPPNVRHSTYLACLGLLMRRS